MISFEPSEEELTLKEAVHRFAAERMRPALRSAEEEGVPDRLVREFRELGVGLMTLPAEVGGAGLGARAIAVIEEELAWGDPGIAAAFPRPGLAGHAVAALAHSVRTRWLAPFVSGSAQAAAAAVFGRGGDGRSGITARPEGDAVIVDGSYDLVAGADATDWTLAAVDLDGRPALLAVERDTPGSAFISDPNRLGLRTVRYGRLELKQSRVPAGALLATGPAASRGLRFGLQRELTTWTAWAVGTSRAAFEYAARYATERQTFGKAIAEHQAVAFMIAEMGIEVEAARGLLWQAAWELDSGTDDLIGSAGCYAAESAVRITSDAVQVLGGHGYVQDHPVEKWMRDARTIGNLINLLVASLRRVEPAP